MKKAFSLMEVLASITIISIVLVALIEIKNKNVFLLEKTKDSTQIDTFLALGVGLNDFNNTKEDEKIYLKDALSSKDDDIRSYIKDVVVQKKTIEQEPLVFEEEDFSLTVTINQLNYSLKTGENKNFYRFSLEY